MEAIQERVGKISHISRSVIDGNRSELNETTTTIVATTAISTRTTTTTIIIITVSGDTVVTKIKRGFFFLRYYDRNQPLKTVHHQWMLKANYRHHRHQNYRCHRKQIHHHHNHLLEILSRGLFVIIKKS